MTALVSKQSSELKGKVFSHLRVSTLRKTIEYVLRLLGDSHERVWAVHR